ncbi:MULTISPECIES: pilus assembly protein PilM [Paraburkholderia]|jgi:Tfp pilus assembly PilM family ATPase|uniref:Type IV pilus assembly protein PilM n=1 Tax=Paraburkholderia phenazinium TaxID=60549 RepID=A0A1N6L8K1_9BURK|nr:pilus assembly protein PilM [Paraburkholderia phenazinium]SIO65101.1 Type IV pilus assembly protein PilM [Paraburkholderia phenazinium]
MAIKSTLLVKVRRFAAGIDVSREAVKLVVLSQRLRMGEQMRIEYLGAVPLAAGAMAGGEIVDRTAVTRAMREVFADLPRACASHTLRCAMALPGSATLMSSVPLARFGAAGELAVARGATLAGLEPAVLVEAERMAGIERHALAVDWFIDGAPSRAASVAIATAARQHLEARIECAAAAGVTLTAIDGEPHAALRALRHAAMLELEPHESYAAIWIGADGVYGWRIDDEAVTADMHYPAPEHADLADALRDLVGGPEFDCALLGGELELLDGVGFSVADIGDVLGCSVLPFECRSLGDCARSLCADLLYEPTCAVAFGLALRGVME